MELNKIYIFNKISHYWNAWLTELLNSEHQNQYNIYKRQVTVIFLSDPVIQKLTSDFIENKFQEAAKPDYIP